MNKSNILSSFGLDPELALKYEWLLPLLEGYVQLE